MFKVTKQQIEIAKEWDLLPYLQAREPNELRRSGPREYCTRTHDSLKISNGKWCWHSRGIGGRTALDYLIKVRDMTFVEAVESLCGSRAPPPQEGPKPKPPKPFQLPEASRFPSAMLAYLQGRGTTRSCCKRVSRPAYSTRAGNTGTAFLWAKIRQAVPGLPACGGRGTTFGWMWRAATSGIVFPCWPLTRRVHGWPWRRAPLTPFPWLRW